MSMNNGRTKMAIATIRGTARKSTTKVVNANSSSKAVAPTTDGGELPLPEGDARKKYNSRCALAPHYNATAILEVFAENTWGEVDAQTIADGLKEKILKAHRGDIRRAETILMAQAHSLDTIFTNLGRRAGKNFGAGYLETAETYLKLALRAQNQCRATLETLAAIKNPPVVFAKQANISNGHQQVNNGSFATDTHSHAETIENRPNELMERDHGEWLDTRAAGTASTGNKAVATVAVIDGTADRNRQSKRAA